MKKRMFMKFLKARVVRLAALVLCFAMICSIPAMASESGEYGFSYASGVTTDMCSPSYWYDKAAPESDAVLMEPQQIRIVNRAAVDGAGTKVFDLTELSQSYNADTTRDSLASISIPKRELYIGNQLLDNTVYFTEIGNAIRATGYTGTRPTEYAVCTRYAPLRAYPISDIIGYSSTDPDDEMQSSALVVNEPFVVRQRCEYKGKLYYYGYSTNCTGWVCADNLAICQSREQWLDAWQVALDGSDFLVVTQDKIYTEPSILTPYASEVKLTLGTILKLVPKEEIPTNIGERNTWHNYVVYLPTRNADGIYVKRPALISQHYNVSIGFLPVTQKNLLNAAFSCLGNRYGWGGMLDSPDCSLYSRTIYRCFGFELPRNTTWQQLVPNTRISLAGMSDAQKQQFLSTLPAGALLYFDGHCMVYTGTENGVNYVISATGSASDSVGELNVQSIYSCILNPLTVRRRDGSTWLNNIDAVVLVMPKMEISDCAITAEQQVWNNQTKVTVTYHGMPLYKGLNYSVSEQNGVVTVTGMNNCTGAATQTVSSAYFEDVPANAYYADAANWAAEQGIAAGTSDGTFSPANACTRAQIVSFLWRAAGCPQPQGGTVAFTDLRPGAYYLPAVQWAVEQGIACGITATTFDPEGPCTRAQTVTFLCRFAGGLPTGTENPFRDVREGAYYENAVLWAVENHITAGITPSAFAPEKVCTRAEALTFLYRQQAG